MSVDIIPVSHTQTCAVASGRVVAFRSRWSAEPNEGLPQAETPTSVFFPHKHLLQLWSWKIWLSRIFWIKTAILELAKTVWPMQTKFTSNLVSDVWSMGKDSHYVCMGARAALSPGVCWDLSRVPFTEHPLPPFTGSHISLLGEKLKPKPSFSINLDFFFFWGKLYSPGWH